VIVSLHGGYCNRTVFRAELDRIPLAGPLPQGCPAVLSRPGRPAPPGRRGDLLPPRRSARLGIILEARPHSLCGKAALDSLQAVSGVLWQRGSGTRPGA